MATGMALTLGLNSVNPKLYGGWSGELSACEADAEDMASIAKGNKFKVTTLMTKAATRARLVAEITKAARTLKSGDIFMLSYSGHGGQLPDINDDEPDAEDETWCLYDGELIDDEICQPPFLNLRGDFLHPGSFFSFPWRDYSSGKTMLSSLRSAHEVFEAAGPCRSSPPETRP